MRPEGLEPPALCSEDRCSNPLSYGRTSYDGKSTPSVKRASLDYAQIVLC